MAEMTLEQKRALAMAAARARAAQSSEGPTRANARAAGLPESLPKERTLTDRAMGAVRTVNEGLSFGYGDEGAAGIQAVLGDPKSGKFFDYSRPLGERYRSGLGQEEVQREAFAENNPVLSPALEIGSAIASGTGLAKGGATLMGRGATGARNVALGVGEGAAYGGLYGSGKAEPGSRLPGLGYGALAGAAAGGAGTAALQGITGALTRRAAVKAAPQIDDLKAQAGKIYDQVEASGVRATPDQTGDLFGKFRDLLRRREVMTPEGRIAGADNYSAVKDAYRLMKDYAEHGMSATAMKEIRSNLMEAAGKSGKPGKIASEMVDLFDDFSGPISTQIKEANVLYSRAMKGRTIDRAIEKAVDDAGAAGSGGNIENALRRNIRSVLNSERQSRGFTATEREAMRAFVKGGKVQNFARLVGKLSPGGNGLMLMINTVAPTALAASTANPLFLAPAIGGAVAKALADKGARRGADTVSALVRSGGQLPQKVPPSLLSPDKQAAYARIMAALGGRATGQELAQER